MTSPIEVLSPSEVTTLVQGPTISLSTRRGEVRPAAILGYFHRDERIISSLSIQVDGTVPPLLSSNRVNSTTERIAVLAALDEYRNGQALLVRRRVVTAESIDEALELRSFSSGRATVIEVVLQSDGASILDLKVAKQAAPAPLPWSLANGRASIERNGSVFVTVTADAQAALRVEGDDLILSWKTELDTTGVWEGRWSALISEGGSSPSTAATSSFAPLAEMTVSGSDYRWTPAIVSARNDLSALIIELPEHQRRFIGAGAPWFQAIFGRDSILAAWQALPLGTAIALDVLDTLALFQGEVEDLRTRQSPGKILHERRIGRRQVFGLESGLTYFGSVDASALFVMLLAEAYRWGAPVERVKALLPAARRALGWCRGEATRPGGIERGPFVWYTPDVRGLGNQGWKDSGDCMVHADGSQAEGPIAVAEAQSYVYEALRGLARLERDLGDPSVAHRHEHDAATLARAFEEAFWDESSSLIALALDGHAAPLRVATSNMGQCLWSGLLSPSIAERVAHRMVEPDLLMPWGLRTLSDREVAYNPLGYHLGTVWAHDSAIVAAGMARHRVVGPFRTLTSGLLDAAEAFEWRLPELFGGLDTASDGAPLPYPASCSPQAWAAGTPLLLLRSMLGLEPDVPARSLTVRSMLAKDEHLRVQGMILGGQPVTLTAVGAEVKLTGDGLGLKVIHD